MPNRPIAPDIFRQVRLQGFRKSAMTLGRGMMKRVLMLCLVLTGCSAMPEVDWPAGASVATPDLLPLDQIAVPTSPALDARGAALAAEAAALKARAAAIGAP